MGTLEASRQMLFKLCVPIKHGKLLQSYRREVFYVRRVEDLMETSQENAYIRYIFGKIELLSIHAT